MADQFRYDATGLNGEWVRTPFLDRIASEGVNFRRCYTTSPVCMPTRVSMATGLYPHNTNLWSNRSYFLTESVPTWTALIREAGYRTSIFGKTHLYSHTVADLRNHEDVLSHCGFETIEEIPGPRAAAKTRCHMTDRWESLGLLEAYKRDYAERFANKPYVVRPSVLPLEEYADVYIARKAAEYLRAYDEDAPWFCWLSFGGPHEPWDTPEPYASMYDSVKVPAAIPRPEVDRDRPRGQLDVLLGNGIGTEEYVSTTASRDSAPNHAPQMTLEEVSRIRANYAGNVTLIDDQIGAVLKVIEDRGELENTIIVFTSDHGEMNGDYGLIYKENFLDSACRVPLIVRTPETLSDANAGSSLDTLVEWFDVGPTLVELAGGAMPYRQFARSLVPVVEGQKEVHRADAFSEIRGESMLVTDRWKVAINSNGRPYMLFDLAKDPREIDNLAGCPDYREIETELSLRLLERIAGSYVDERN